MGTRNSPSGPRSNTTGFVALAQTVVPAGSAAGVAVTATGVLSQFIVHKGAASITKVDPKLFSTNDIVSGSPRALVPLATSQISVSYMRLASVGSANVVVEMAFSNPSNAQATVLANTWNINVALQSADL